MVIFNSYVKLEGILQQRYCEPMINLPGNPMGTQSLITPPAILRHSPMKMPVTAARRQNLAWPTISFMVSLTLADHPSKPFFGKSQNAGQKKNIKTCENRYVVQKPPAWIFQVNSYVNSALENSDSSPCHKKGPRSEGSRFEFAVLAILADSAAWDPPALGHQKDATSMWLVCY